MVEKDVWQLNIVINLRIQVAIRKNDEICFWANFMVKLLRAYGGCLGTSRRWRTWKAAISDGKKHSFDEPSISEWGNPITAVWIHRTVRANSGKWTISVPEGKENNSDFVSSGERTRSSLNQQSLLCWGRGIKHNGRKKLTEEYGKAHHRAW